MKDKANESLARTMFEDANPGGDWITLHWDYKEYWRHRAQDVIADGRSSAREDAW